MPPEGFEPAVPPSERPQTHASVRTVLGIGTTLKTRYVYVMTLECTKVLPFIIILKPV